MYLITNRAILSKSGKVNDVFGDATNIKGPNELRVSAVKKSGGKWHAEVLDDELPKAEVEKLALPQIEWVDYRMLHERQRPIRPDTGHQESLAGIQC